MSNLSKIRRDKMIEFLETLKEQHSDDESLIAINQIEKELVSKRYGLVWEEHKEAVDVMMRDNIPVFTEVKEREICMVPGEDYNFLLEGDNLHSLHLLEKTHLAPYTQFVFSQLLFFPHHCWFTVFCQFSTVQQGDPVTHTYNILFSHIIMLHHK